MAAIYPLSKDQFGLPFSLVPKFHFGTPPVPREIPFRADSGWSYRVKIGNEIASTSAFPSTTWERGMVQRSAGQWSSLLKIGRPELVEG
jgi:hypothetical protein